MTSLQDYFVPRNTDPKLGSRVSLTSELLEAPEHDLLACKECLERPVGQARPRRLVVLGAAWHSGKSDLDPSSHEVLQYQATSAAELCTEVQWLEGVVQEVALACHPLPERSHTPTGLQRTDLFGKPCPKARSVQIFLTSCSSLLSPLGCFPGGEGEPSCAG